MYQNLIMFSRAKKDWAVLDVLGINEMIAFSRRSGLGIPALGIY